MKVCNKCGTTANLKIDKLGRHYSMCKSCWAKIVSEAHKDKILSEKHRKNISKGRIGIQFSEEHKHNISKSGKGKLVSEETRRKLSIASKGRKQSLEAIENWKISRKGYRHSEETRRKISEIQKGRKQSKEQIEARVKKLIGKKRTKEHCDRMSKINTGRRLSEETKRKISEINMGKKLSNEIKLKISKSNKGKKLSEETKRKISEYHKTEECQRKIILAMKKNGTDGGKSKPEDKFYIYLIENIDKNTQRQILHKGFTIDFYLPYYDIYIQFDGDYWHGLLNTEEELMKSKRGIAILGTMKRDKIQNDTIPNLIRVRESEFLKELNKREKGNSALPFLHYLNPR